MNSSEKVLLILFILIAFMLGVIIAIPSARMQLEQPQLIKVCDVSNHCTIMTAEQQKN